MVGTRAKTSAYSRRDCGSDRTIEVSNIAFGPRQQKCALQSCEQQLGFLRAVPNFLGIAIGWFIFRRNPLKHMPDVLENKFYAPGIGIVKTIHPNDGEEEALIEIRG